MNKIRFILFFILTSHIIWGADTTFYENGNIKTIYKYKKYRKEFYESGLLKQGIKYDKIWRRCSQINYDSLGRVSSKGKKIFNWQKHGKWKLYVNGELEEKVKYKYGFEKDSLISENGKKIKCYLTYGRGSWLGPCITAQKKYDIRYTPVAGCFVTRRLLLRTTIHNYFTSMTMVIKYGQGWKEEINGICGYPFF